MLSPELLETIYHEIGLTNMSADDKVQVIDQLSEHFTKLAFDTTINTFNDEQYGRFTYYANNATDLNLLDQQISSIAAEVPDLDNKIMLAIADEVGRLKASANAIK